MTNNLFRKGAEVLLMVNGAYCITDIAFGLRTTHAFVCNRLKMLERNGIISFEKQGRIKVINLTRKGEIIKTHLQGIKALLHSGL